MFGKSHSKTKEEKTSTKLPTSRIVHDKSKDPNPNDRIFNSTPLRRKPIGLESPLLKKKSSRDSTCSSIPSPINVKSFGAVNDIMKRSSTEDKQIDSVELERLRSEVKELSIQYQNEVKNLRKENFSIQEEIQKVKKEIFKALNDQNELMKKKIDQLDIEVRMVNKSIQNIQSHYSKFVSFVSDNLLMIVKNEEHLLNRIRELEQPHSSLDKVFQSSKTSYNNTSSSSSYTYSISISPLTKTDYYKLVFTPVDQISISKFAEQAREQVYSLPTVQGVAHNHLSHSLSAPNGYNSVHRKLVLGTKTMPYYLKRINATENDSTFRSSDTSNRRKYDYHNRYIESLSTKNVEEERDLCDLCASISSTSRFRDLKKRHLKLQLRGFKWRSYPCLNSPTIESERSDEGDDFYNSQADINMSRVDSGLFICQSDTDMLGEKFNSISWDDRNASNTYNQTPVETVIYQQLSNNLVQDLGTLESYSRDLHYQNQFSIILPRSKLSSLLSSNFTNISSFLTSHEDSADYGASYTQVKPKFKDPCNIDDSNYFTLISNSQLLPTVNMASAESLTDNEAYIDDDYFQQVLHRQQNDSILNSMNNIYDSYDQFFNEINQFSLPKSFVNDA